MKKLLLLLTLSAILTSSIAFAQDEDENDQLGVVPPTLIKVTNPAQTEHAVWVTIYNGIARISDVACLTPGKVAEFWGYMPPFEYQVRAEVLEGSADCGGRVISDQAVLLKMGVVGIDTYVYRDEKGFHIGTK